jgi:hypothetical protein
MNSILKVKMFLILRIIFFRNGRLKDNKGDCYCPLVKYYCLSHPVVAAAVVVEAILSMK